VNHTGWRTFLMFGIFCLANGVFVFFFKETKGQTLESMDVLFGTVDAEKRATDVERMLETHADVSQAAVVPIDDDIKGQKPVAFIILKAGRHPTVDEIRQYALANAPAYQHPRFVWFLDKLPLASTNKIDRIVLQKLAEERVSAERTH